MLDGFSVVILLPSFIIFFHHQLPSYKQFAVSSSGPDLGEQQPERFRVSGYMNSLDLYWVPEVPEELAYLCTIAVIWPD